MVIAGNLSTVVWVLSSTKGQIRVDPGSVNSNVLFRVAPIDHTLRWVDRFSPPCSDSFSYLFSKLEGTPLLIERGQSLNCLSSDELSSGFDGAAGG